MTPPDGGRRRTVLLVHSTPDALGGSEQTLLLSAAALRTLGWRIVLVHGQQGLDAAAAYVDSDAALPALFARPSVTGASARAEQRRRLTALVHEEQVAVAHAHLWGSWAFLRDLRRAVPTVATAHLPVCPNGARYRYARERVCERPVGAGCLTWGYRHEGCGHTADEQPFGVPAMAAAIAETRLTLAQLARSATVVAPSAWQHRQLVADGVPASRVVTVPPPIVAPPTHAPRASGPRRVVLAARLNGFKGGHHLLAASAAVDVSHEVHIVGDGPARAALERQATSLQIADRVHFHGRLASEDAGRLIASCDWLAVPSLWPETFGMAGAEAVAAGCRVLAYDHAGVSDWLDPAAGDIAVATPDVAALTEGLREALSRPRCARDVTPETRPGVSADDHAAQLAEIYERTMPGRVRQDSAP
jgi:glycosyltransferase involved in cell wall biosynthesis